MGGKSPEHDISIISGREVVRNLDTAKYKIVPVIISRNGIKWKYISVKRLLAIQVLMYSEKTKTKYTNFLKSNLSAEQILSKSENCLVFIAMHGPFGEDGTIQGFLEYMGVRYTGSGVLSSAIGMDKIMFKNIMHSLNIPIPKYIVVRKNTVIPKLGKKLGPFPYFIKPSNQGSSVGAAIVKNEKELILKLKNVYRYCDTALVEEYIPGKEITCAIIGNEKPKTLPLIEIIPSKADFFDYRSKYTDKGASEIVPAKISERLRKKIQNIAINVYSALNCRGFARVDFLLRNKQFPVVLEINTIPGLTPASLFPKAAKAAGYSYAELLDKIINYAVEN